MSFRNTNNSYGTIAKFFHWTISPLVILMLTFGYFMGDLPKDYQNLGYGTHKQIGLLILALVTLRLIWALMNPKPVLAIGTPAWERLLARMTHFCLYIFVILMPLVGWIGSVAGGHPPMLGSFAFNLPIAENKTLAHTAFDLHGTFAIVLIVLISLHVLAALYHHFVRRDDVLRRMLP